MNVDVAIIGGGMVGATLACALRESPYDVVLIDPKPVNSSVTDTRFDLRVSAITRASQRIFSRLGVWEAMLALGVSPFREMHVWEQPGAAEMHFDSADLSEPYLGHIIENRVILAALYAGIEQQGQVQCRLGSGVQAVHHEDTHWRLTLQDNSEITATLLVGADGSQSWLRREVGIAVRGWDYDQKAVVTYVQTAASHQHTAWQRFLENGPLAFLPLNENYSSIVWSTSPQHADELLALDEAAFAQALAAAYDERLGEVTEVGPRAAFPLRFLIAEDYVRPGLALIGDAAHTIHPLAGQGVNLGIMDAASLAQTITQAAHKRAIGSHALLRRYERWRRSENMDMLIMVDQIQRLFGIKSDALSRLRMLGMAGVNRISPLKNFIIQHAMGNHGDLPVLAQ